MKKTIVVIGGGITGLATLYYLQKQSVEANFILIEKEHHLGGKIHSIKNESFIMEAGADSIVARNKNVLPFIQELNLTDEIVYNETGKSYIYADHQLHPIPDETIFGIPTSIKSLFNSSLLSTKGKIAALKDFITKNKSFTENSSVGAFLESFLGKEIVEKQIGPVLSGVYSGKLEELTMSSTLPYLLEYKNKYGSIIRGFSKHKEKFLSASNKKFISFRNGLSQIIDKLEEALTDVTIHKGLEITKIDRSEQRYIISAANGQEITADYVVLTTPHQVSRALLQHKVLDVDFAKFKNSSVLSIYLGYRFFDHQLPVDGTGFIVAKKDGLQCDACTWTSRKWKHTSKNQQLLVRLFYKSANPVYSTLLQRSDTEIIDTAHKDIEKSLSIHEKPVAFEITHWKDSMPNYHMRHHLALVSLEKNLEKHFPHLWIGGCSYYGVGIAACIANGEEIAEKVALHF
ncbi:protoporphyrinogen oxidase [Bacillaceae bacterium Marseille-Q3522]|nr:protoporphyrinogen oxidase [Bacillaceae bacterium Marseille-Q3522]